MSDELLNRIAELEGELDDERRRSRVMKHFYDTHKDGGVKDAEVKRAFDELKKERDRANLLERDNKELRLLLKKARCEAAIRKTRETIAQIERDLSKLNSV